MMKKKKVMKPKRIFVKCRTALVLFCLDTSSLRYSHTPVLKPLSPQYHLEDSQEVYKILFEKKVINKVTSAIFCYVLESIDRICRLPVK